MAKGAAWMVFMRFAIRGLGLVSTVFLARLLVPEDFGLVALSASVLFAVEAFGQFSFDIALIRNTRAARSHYDTVWTLGLIRGVILAIVIVAIAEPMGHVFGDPRLPPIIYWLALTTVLEGLQNVGIIDFRKHLQFRREFTLAVSQKVVGFIVTLTLAWLYREYWALVAGIVAGRFAGTVLSYAMHAYRPHLCIAEWRELLGFSKWLLLNNILHFLVSALDIFIIGRFFGAHSLGLYKVASEIASLPSSELVAPIQRAIYPGFAKLAHDPALLRTSYIDGVAILMMLAVPAASGIAMLADPIVRVLLGANWLEAIALLQILALNGIIRLASANSSSVLLALGRPNVISHLSLLHLLLLGPMLAAGIYFGGLVGAAWALVVMSCIGLALSYRIALRALSVPFRRLLAAVWRSWAAAAAMALVLTFLLEQPFEWLGAPAVRLVVGVPLGAFIYFGAHWVLWRLAGSPKGAEEHVMAFVASFRRPVLASQSAPGRT